MSSPSQTIDGTLRLRAAGVGSTVAGVAFIVMTLVGVPYVVSSCVVLAVAVSLLLYERKRDDLVDSRPSLGVGAVGCIGLLEAIGFGLGMSPIVLGGFAIGAGIVDILVGGLLGRLRSGAE